MPLRVEAPDLPQREDEDDNVGHDVGHGVADEEVLRVDARGLRIRLIPESVDGVAREDGDEDHRDPLRHDDRLHNVGRELELGHGEDAAVEGQDGELDGEDGGAVEEFVGEEALCGFEPFVRQQVCSFVRAFLFLGEKNGLDFCFLP